MDEQIFAGFRYTRTDKPPSHSVAENPVEPASAPVDRFHSVELEMGSITPHVQDLIDSCVFLPQPTNDDDDCEYDDEPISISSLPQTPPPSPPSEAGLQPAPTTQQVPTPNHPSSLVPASPPSQTARKNKGKLKLGVVKKSKSSRRQAVGIRIRSSSPPSPSTNSVKETEPEPSLKAASCSSARVLPPTLAAVEKEKEMERANEGMSIPTDIFEAVLMYAKKTDFNRRYEGMDILDVAAMRGIDFGVPRWHRPGGYGG